MTRRELLAATAAPLAARLWAQKKSQAPPNLVLIIVDDLAAWMLGIYGNKEIRTPGIDLLARSGTRFQNAFACAPVPGPNRAALLTGRTPLQQPSSPANEALISDVLASRGYRCGYTGPWELGDDAKPQHHFDYWYTMRDAGAATQRASEFLDQQKATQPFFLVTSYSPTDEPPQKYAGMYAKTTFNTIGWARPAPNAAGGKDKLGDIVGNIRKRAASVTALDDQIPALVQKLDQRGVRDDTLIVLAGANGFLLGRHGLWSDGLASDPINMYDEVMRIPMIWNWPGRVPPEAMRPEMVSVYDLVPSLCEIAGAPAPSGNLCGRSFVPLATGHALPKKKPWPITVFGHFRNTEMARDNRFKLVLRAQGAGPNQLYAIRSDPGEQVNQYDNPQFLTVREHLTAELTAWRNRYSS